VPLRTLCPDRNYEAGIASGNSSGRRCHTSSTANTRIKVSNVQTSEQVEGLIIGVASALFTTAGIISQLPIPAEQRAPLVTIVAGVGSIMLAFWYGYVNKKPNMQ